MVRTQAYIATATGKVFTLVADGMWTKLPFRVAGGDLAPKLHSSCNFYAGLGPTESSKWDAAAKRALAPGACACVACCCQKTLLRNEEHWDRGQDERKQTGGYQ